MRIGTFQFKASRNCKENFDSLCRCIDLANSSGVELILTQECGLTGYPPTEVPSVQEINNDLTMHYLELLKDKAKKACIALGVGSVVQDATHFRNRYFFFLPDDEETFWYDKRALWGWDVDNFAEGTSNGIFSFRGIRFGVRICFEIRFPEYFRELFDEGAELFLVPFSDISTKIDETRRNILTSHLITRAVENATPLLSSNGLGYYQSAPSCFVSADGIMMGEASKDAEELIHFDYEKDKASFGRAGRIEISKKIRNLTKFST